MESKDASVSISQPPPQDVSFHCWSKSENINPFVARAATISHPAKDEATIKNAKLKSSIKQLMESSNCYLKKSIHSRERSFDTLDKWSKDQLSWSISASINASTSGHKYQNSVSYQKRKEAITKAHHKKNASTSSFIKSSYGTVMSRKKADQLYASKIKD